MNYENEQQLQQYINQIQQLKKRIREIEELFSSLDEQHCDQLKELKDQNKKLLTQNRKMGSRLGLLEDENAALSAQLEELTKKAENSELAEKAARDVVELFEDKQNWTLTTYGDETFIISSRKSEIKDAKESMLMLETELDMESEKLEKLLAPWMKWRLQWDDMLEDATCIFSYANDIWLLRHTFKSISLSARESIDIVKVTRTLDRIIFASCRTSHNGYPPSKAYVRTHQYVCGYIIERLPQNRSKFTIIFHADLNLPGPQIISSLADRLKSCLMIENVRRLKDGIERFRAEL